jgi:Zn-dependent metalloprotease
MRRLWLAVLLFGCDSGSGGDDGVDGGQVDGGLDGGPDGSRPDGGGDAQMGDAALLDGARSDAAVADADGKDAAVDAAVEGPDPRLDDPTAAGLGRLAGQSARPLVVEGAGGLPRVVLLDVPAPGEPVAAALQFLKQNNDIWRVGDVYEGLFLTRRAPHEGGGESLTFGQRVDNVPIEGAHLVVEVVGERVRSVQGRWTPEPVGGEAPTLTATEAVERVQAMQRTVPGEARLTWYDPAHRGEAGPLQPAWSVLAEQGGRWSHLLLSAGDGAVLVDRSLDQTGGAPDVGEVFNAANDTGQLCFFLNPKPRIWRAGRLGPFNPADLDSTRAEAAVPAAFSWYLNALGRNGWNGSGGMLGFYIHYGMAFVNARWVPVCNHTEFGDGIATDDIIAHELTHGVVQATAGLVYEGESGALNESYADLFAFLITRDENLGDGSIFGTSCAGAPAGTIRSMRDPAACGLPDHMLAAQSGDGVGFRTINLNDGDNGAVHTNSSIQNKVGWLLARGGTHTGLIISPIGEDRTAQLFYRTLTRRLPSGARLQDAATLTLDEAGRMRTEGLLDGAAVCQVRNAFASVGLAMSDADCDGTLDVGEADADGDGVLDAVDNCPLIRNPGQADRDADSQGDVCDADADGDGVRNLQDNCPNISNGGQEDRDANGTGDACQDGDRDGWVDARDNCPNATNPTQIDRDGDGRGDACDPDLDGDSLPNEGDLCPTVPNLQDGDDDGDRVGNACDNCRNVANPDQANLDRDREGDACDTDRDGDGKANGQDLCPDDARYNSQTLVDFVDGDQDGVPLECDPDEQALLGQALDRLRGRLRVIQPGILRLPIPICLQCPDVFGPEARVRFQMDATQGTGFRVVDDSGRVLAHPTEGERFQHGNVQVIDLALPPDLHYRAPVEGRSVYQGRRLFIELYPPVEVLNDDFDFQLSAEVQGL